MLNKVSPKSVFRYAVMPEIGSRSYNLFAGGFGYIPFFIAAVYQMVGLLPKNHPYVLQKNIGRFGIRHVVAEAASNVKFGIKHIDQIILFIAILVGLSIFMIQFIAIILMVAFQPVMAMPTNWLGFFSLGIAPGLGTQDMAYMMLDMVFGVPLGDPLSPNTGFFQSCISTATLCTDNFGNPINSGGSALQDIAVVGGLGAVSAQFSPLSSNASLIFPYPFHDGLHRLFAIYSNGLLVIAVGITSYFIITILAETAQSGTPFGKRFNKTWAPIRIVIAFGLLMPLSVGLNSSQYLVLYAAKYGSAFATNGWSYFNTTLATSYQAGVGGGQDLVSVPNIPELRELSNFLFVARTCKGLYEFYKREEIRNGDATAVPPIPAVANYNLTVGEQLHLYIVRTHHVAPYTYRVDIGTSYENIANYLAAAPAGEQANNAVLRFGVVDEEFEAALGSIIPICGEIGLLLNDPQPVANAQPAPYQIQEAYFNLIRDFWHGQSTGVLNGAGGASALPFTNAANHRSKQIAIKHGKVPDTFFTGNHTQKLDIDFVQDVRDNMQIYMNARVSAAVAAQNLYGGWTGNDAPLQSKGWAAAGIWYNKIAQLNGVTVASAYGAPIIKKYPAVMEKVSEKRTTYNKSDSSKDRFQPSVIGINDISNLLSKGYGMDMAVALNVAYTLWNTAAGTDVAEASGNPALSIITLILGVDGLYSMRKNPSTHPLAMLSGIGRGLVEGSIRSLTYAAIAVGADKLGIVPKGLAAVPANFFVTISMLGLTVGFIMFYVVPFLPFIYFFFAVGGWIKGIFEAMVGAPLWALAHIRIDGNGMPGNAAMNGYFLIFEVFLRPILTVFGLLASILIFSALVSVLNAIFPMVVQNTAGYDVYGELGAAASTISNMRSEIDQFFFTVIYAIIVYILGMSSFKLIDMIPNNILRWMGQSVATFGDQREDPAQGLVSKATVGSQQAMSKIGGGLGKAVGAATA